MSQRPPLPHPDQFRFHVDVEVRFRDLDAMGHVNNAVYATYFEVARLGYVKALGTPESGDVRGLFPFIMLDLQIRFVSESRLGDVLRVHVRTASVGTKSFVFEYLVTRVGDGAVVTVGSSTLVYFDWGQHRTLPVPADFRERLERLEGRRLGP
jgi:acyl-CoA thioester hydrolase